MPDATPESDLDAALSIPVASWSAYRCGNPAPHAPHRGMAGPSMCHGNAPLTRVEIDPNKRTRHNHTITGLNDSDGPLTVGQHVTMYESESGLTGPGEVVSIDPAKELVELAIDWTQLRSPDESETAPAPVPVQASSGTAQDGLAGNAPLARVKIDLNIVTRGGQTRVGFEDADGPLQPGQSVEVFESESGLTGTGTVTAINTANRLAWIAVDRRALVDAPTEVDISAPDANETGLGVGTIGIRGLLAHVGLDVTGRDITVDGKLVDAWDETAPPPCTCTPVDSTPTDYGRRPALAFNALSAALQDSDDHVRLSVRDRATRAVLEALDGDAGNLEPPAAGSSKPGDDLNPAPADATLRDRMADAMWRAAEYMIVAEWICCEPLNPKHDLCAKGYAALDMIRACILDNPQSYKPAPLPDAVLAVVQPVLDELADCRERADTAEAERVRLLTEFPWLRASEEDRETAEEAIARVREVLPFAEKVAATSGPGPASAATAIADRLRAALTTPADQPDGGVR